MTTKISFGKVAYSTDRKVNEIEVELNIKNVSGRDYETLQDVKDVPVISICGGVWNSRKTDYEMCGQCIDHLVELLPTNTKLKRISEIWEQYHLNYMNAGTKKQCEAVEIWRKENNIKGWAYEQEKEHLKSIDLLSDNSIIWGNQWFYRSIPENIINELKSLFNIIN